MRRCPPPRLLLPPALPSLHPPPEQVCPSPPLPSFPPPPPPAAAAALAAASYAPEPPGRRGWAWGPPGLCLHAPPTPSRALPARGFHLSLPRLPLPGSRRPQLSLAPPGCNGTAPPAEPLWCPPTLGPSFSCSHLRPPASTLGGSRCAGQMDRWAAILGDHQKGGQCSGGVFGSV